MPIDKKKKQEYDKEYYKSHRAEKLAKSKEYYKNNQEDCLAQNKQYYKDNRDDLLAKQKKYNESHKAEKQAYDKKYNESHKAEKSAYNKADTNSAGVPKQNIRSNSYRYLFNTLGFQKIDDYENHHCFGYETEKEFIYIPRWLHKSVIHPFLRKNNIDADTNHFEQIKHLLDNCKEKIYIIKDGKVTEYN